MKFLTALLSLCMIHAAAISAARADAAMSGHSSAADQKQYADFLGQFTLPANVAELIALMDKLVDAAEHGLVDEQPDPGLVEATSKTGLRIEFSASKAKKAVVYFLRISRHGERLHYDDAAKFAALFTDRAGLPHPLNINESNGYNFSTTWIIKPSEWKKFRKNIDAARKENRAEKDPAKAFVTAVQRELAARSEATLNR